MIEDPFLIPGKSYQRLRGDYIKYGSLWVGYDFDDTVHDFHKRGAVYPKIIELLWNLKSINCKLTCWTAYEDLDYVRSYLVEHDIPFDDINGDGIKLPWPSRKPFFSTLLDDRVGLIQVYTELAALVEEIKTTKS